MTRSEIADRTHMTEGRVIHGRYRLISKLGQGGMGSVWRAIHLELGTPVAVKLIDPAVADSKMALTRFKREAQSAASLRGSNVVQILDYGIDDDCPYIAMELLEGESLATRIARKAPLSPRETSRILGQVGKALTRAHAQNIVHRDLKPDNIFIVRDSAPGVDGDGEDEITKVLDFGIAKTMSTASFEASIQTKSGAILGTPHYMSPEQASGRSAVDHRSDIWSLGVIAYECLTGCRPFNGATLGGLVIAICTEPIPIPSHVATVPVGFDEWFARCAHRLKSERFQTISEAVGALRAVCDPPNAVDLAMVSYDGPREMTLQASTRRPSLRVPSGSDARARASEAASTSSADETLPAASRTLGSIPRNRSIWAYVGLAVVLAGGAAAGVAGYRQWSAPPIPSSAAPSVASSLENTPTTAVSPTPLAAATGIVAGASAAPIVVSGIQVSPSTPPARPVAGHAKTTVDAKASAASTKSLDPKPQDATTTNSKTLPPLPAATAADQPSAPTIAATQPTTPSAQGEPAHRPDPAPSDGQSVPRKKNVEDRLAF